MICRPLCCWMLALIVGLAGPAPTMAAEYYVDSRSGNDSAAGTAAQAAWKTLARVNKARLLAGDTVYLRRGCVWRETLMPSGDGTKDNPVTFAAYGDGARPAIYGSDDVSGEGRWSAGGEGIWVLNGTKIADDKNRTMIFHDGVGAARRASAAELKDPWDWAYDPAAGKLSVRLDHSPGRHAMELVQRNGVGFSGSPFITLRGLEIGYALFGIGIWQAEGWVVEDCYLHDALIDCFHANGAERAPDRGTVRNCVIRDWDWIGHGMEKFDARDPNWQRFEPSFGYGIHVLRGDDWTVTGNDLRLVHVRTGMDCTPLAFDGGANASLIAENTIDAGKGLHGGGGIMFWRPQGTVPTVIRDNVILNTGSMGINASEFDAHRFTAPVTIEGNVIINVNKTDSIDTEAIRIWTNFDGAGPIIVRNNVIRHTPKGQFDHPGIRVRQSQDVTLERNIITGVDTGISIERGAQAKAIGNISAGNRKYACFVDESSKLDGHDNVWAGQVHGFTPGSGDVVKEAKP